MNRERGGVLLVRKPRAPTSHDIVDAVRKSTGVRRVGHAGALDPLAEGLLVILVGRAARLAEYFKGLEKTYLARVVLGHASETDDADGPLTPVRPGGPFPAREEIESLLKGRFTGELAQRPPAYSALHVAGKRAHALARKGEKVELPERRVVVHELELLRYGPPEMNLRARVSSGTYIRALARDVGDALGVGGYLAGLVRTGVGPFSVEEAIEPEEATPSKIIPACAALVRFMPRLEVSEEEARELAHGRAIEGSIPGERAAAAMGEALVAVVRRGRSLLRPEKVFLRPS